MLSCAPKKEREQEQMNLFQYKKWIGTKQIHHFKVVLLVGKFDEMLVSSLSPKRPADLFGWLNVRPLKTTMRVSRNLGVINRENRSLRIIST